MQIKKWLSLFTALLLVVQSAVVLTGAEEPAVSLTDVSADPGAAVVYEAEETAAAEPGTSSTASAMAAAAASGLYITDSYVNPLYEGLTIGELPADTAESGFRLMTEEADVVFHDTAEEAAEVLLDGMKARESVIVLGVTAELYDRLAAITSAHKEIFYAAYAHDPADPTGGDYIRFTFGGWNGAGVKSDEGWTLTYYFDYYTTLAEEEAVDAKVEELTAAWKAMDMTEYQIVRTIYEYITENVTYDDAGLTAYRNAVSSDTLTMSHCKIFTAYKALIKGTAVCQGFANLFYRLALEMGVDARIIASVKAENHAWNIVKLGRWYYNVDATWDAENVETGYLWFLLNEEEFSVKHTRRAEFDTEEFHDAHPMGYGSYVGIDETMTGACGDGVYWTLTADGNLIISGNGKTDAFTLEGTAPWYPYRESIRCLTVEEGVTEIGYAAFCDCTSLESLSLHDGITDMHPYVFYNCKSLTSFSLPASSPCVNANVFEGCTSLRDVYLHDNTYVIYFEAFEGCTALTEIAVPQDVFMIGTGAFEDCTNLEGIYFYGSDFYFEGNYDFLVNVTPTLYYVAGTAHWENWPNAVPFEPDMSHVQLPVSGKCGENVTWTLDQYGVLTLSGTGETAWSTYSGNAPWYSYRSLIRKLVVEEGITVLSDRLVDDCVRLEEIEISSSVTGIKGRFYGCTAMETFEWPVSGTSDFGIECWHSLKELHIPDTVTELGYITHCTSLEELHIPAGITALKAFGINNNPNLQKIYFYSTEDPAGYFSENAIYNTNATLYYPVGAKGWTEPEWTAPDGSVYRTEMYVPEDHTHTYEITVKIDPTCTEAGSITYTCPVCKDTYTEEISPKGHAYGTLVVVESATVLEEGRGYYQCGNCGIRQEKTIAKLTVDANDPNYGIAYFTVIDANTLEPLENIHILVATAKDGECTLTTDAYGKAAQILPVGKQNISVYAKGYLTRNLTITVALGENSLPYIGMSTKPVVESEIIITEMTLEEIIDAGIDVADPDNTHIFKHSVKITFTPEIDVISLDAYFDDTGKYKGGSYTPPSGPNNEDGGGGGDDDPSDDGSEEEDPDSPSESTPVHKDFTDNKFTYPQKDGTIISVYPVSEKFYLIVYGETKWLKEMFDVEMLIVNNSGVDALYDLEAEISLPDGLALADLVSGQQSALVPLSFVGVKSQTSVHWYVRGDEEGTYTIDASLRGLIGAYAQEFAYTYTSDAIHVYAGNALHMNVILPYSTYYGDDYTVRIELENVSPRTLYGVRYTIPGLEQGQAVWYHDGSVKETVLLTAGNAEVIQADTFLPGDKIVVEVSSNILFQSEMMEYQKQKLGEQIGRTKAMVELYDYASKLMEVAEFVISFSKGALIAIGEFVLEEIVEEAMKPDAELLTAAIENIVRIASEDASAASLDTMMRLQSNELYGGLADSLASPEQYTAYLNSLSGNHLKALAASVAVLSLQLEASDVSDILDSIRTMVEALPVAFFVEDVVVSTLDGSTTSIPYTISLDTTKKVQYFGIDSMDDYLRSMLIAAVGKTKEPLYQNIRIESDIKDYKSAEKYLKIQKEQIAAFSAADATGETEFKMYLVSEDGQRSAAELTERFTVSCTNDTAAYSNGVLSFTGGAMLELLPTGDMGGTVCVTANDQVLRTYTIEVVETHTCTSDTWVIEQCQTESYAGLRAKYCDICEQTIVLEPIAPCEEHIWGETVVEVKAAEDMDGISYQACETCGHRTYAFYAYQPEPERPVGDFTGDGEVTLEDADLLAEYFAGYPVQIDKAAADINGDGKLTRADAMILKRYLAGWAGYDRYFG